MYIKCIFMSCLIQVGFNVLRIWIELECHNQYYEILVTAISGNFSHKCSELGLEVRCEVQNFIMKFTSKFVSKASNCLPQYRE